MIFFYKLLIKIFRIFGFHGYFSCDGEDQILEKYFFGIKKGNYIDIGSHHPVNLSNTFLFYLKGWSGICIDPIPLFKTHYKILRPKDLFLNAGIKPHNSNKDDEMNFYFYKKYPDCSTFDKERVDNLISRFDRIPTSINKVPLISVDNLINYYSKFNNINEIHLLNIDTEGYELDICKDFFKLGIFPWIISIEELGYTADNVTNSKVHEVFEKENYLLASRTLLTSIYIKKEIFKKLSSPFLKDFQV